jgi:hypothetical protein
VTIDTFLDHWRLVEHPFRGEDARQDALFTRMVDASVRAASENPLRPSRLPRHPDYDKIAGEFSRPSTSIVFGEKGSGKTAIRLQMATSAAAYNAMNASRRVLLVSYDELAPFLERLHRRLRTVRRGKESPVLDSLRQTRLVDHVDAILATIVPRLVDALLEHNPVASPADRVVPHFATPEEGGPRKQLRKLDRNLKRDLLLLQAPYDRADGGGERTRELRRAMGLRTPLTMTLETVFAYAGWLLPAGVFIVLWQRGMRTDDPVAVTAFFAAMGIWLAALLKRAATERIGVLARARRLYRQLRTTGRTEFSLARSIRQLPPNWRPSTLLPTTDSEEVRLAMMSRLVRVLRAIGYESVVVVLDRADEPPLIQGDPDRMKAVVWPLLSNRFLQLEGWAFKLLLPIELRHQLVRESAAFFQDARMDKQSLIEALGWSGVTLYDLANQRLLACRPPDAPPAALIDLFAPDVTREHLIDALEQMRQPRDAFKLLYQCVQDHCNAATLDASTPATEGPGPFRISKATLDAARRAQVERVRQVTLGVRPG